MWRKGKNDLKLKKKNNLTKASDEQIYGGLRRWEESRTGFLRSFYLQARRQPLEEGPAGPGQQHASIIHLCIHHPSIHVLIHHPFFHHSVIYLPIHHHPSTIHPSIHLQSINPFVIRSSITPSAIHLTSICDPFIHSSIHLFIYPSIHHPSIYSSIHLLLPSSIHSSIHHSFFIHSFIHSLSIRPSISSL